MKKSDELKVSKFEIFFIIMLSNLFLAQSFREILLDRAIIISLLPLLLLLVFSGLLGALFLKFFKHEFSIMIFGILSALGWIFIQFPSPVIIEGRDYYYPLFDFGMILQFLSAPILIITAIGLSNIYFNKISENKSDIESDIEENKYENDRQDYILIVSSAFLGGFIYNWFLRAVGIAENSILNVFMGFALLLIVFRIFYFDYIINQEILKNKSNLFIVIKRDQGKYEQLIKYKHNISVTGMIWLLLPNLLILSLNFSYPDVYAYMSATPKSIVWMELIAGLVIGVIISNYFHSSNNESFKKYEIVLIILLFLNPFLFGSVVFYPPLNPFYNIFYLISGLITGSLVFEIFRIVFEKRLKDLEKILAWFFFLYFIIYFVLKMITAERYMPYMDIVITSIIGISCFILYLIKNRRGA